MTERLTEIHTSKLANSWLRMIHQLSPGPAHHTAPLKSTPLISLVRTAFPDVTATPEDPGITHLLKSGEQFFFNNN